MALAEAEGTKTCFLCSLRTSCKILAGVFAVGNGLVLWRLGTGLYHAIELFQESEAPPSSSKILLAIFCMLIIAAVADLGLNALLFATASNWGNRKCASIWMIGTGIVFELRIISLMVLFIAAPSHVKENPVETVGMILGFLLYTYAFLVVSRLMKEVKKG